MQTFPGGVGKGGPEIQDALNAYHDETVDIPLFDGTCKVKPAGTSPDDCPADQIGVGTNTWYHIPIFGSFKVDAVLHQRQRPQAVRQASRRPVRQRQRGQRLPQGLVGRGLSVPGAIDLVTVSPSTTNRLGVLLIR